MVALPANTRLTGDREYNASKLRHLVTVQEATETQDADGAVVQTWATYATVYADIRPVGGSESFAAQGINASIVHLIDIRYLAGLAPKMRIIWGDRIFEISSVRNIGERDKWMTCACIEEV